jgi:hypothetical protein
MAYVKGNAVPHANHEVLDKLIAARHELSQVVYYHVQNGNIYNVISHFKE